MKEILRYLLYALFVALVVLTVKEDSWAGSLVIGQENRDYSRESEEGDPILIVDENQSSIDEAYYSRYAHGSRDRSSSYRKKSTHRCKEGYKEGYREGLRPYPLGYEYGSRISLRPAYHTPYGRFRDYRSYHTPYGRFRGYSYGGLRP
jgi:hypothetical protein